MLGCAGGPGEGEPWQRTGRLQTSGQNFPSRSLGSQWMGITLAPQGTGDSFVWDPAGGTLVPFCWLHIQNTLRPTTRFRVNPSG